MKRKTDKNNVTASYVIPLSLKEDVIKIADTFEVSASRVTKAALTEFVSKNKNRKPRASII